MNGTLENNGELKAENKSREKLFCEFLNLVKCYEFTTNSSSSKFKHLKALLKNKILLKSLHLFKSRHNFHQLKTPHSLNK